MKIAVNQNVCLGCGLCTTIAPKTFKLNDEGKAEVIGVIADEEEAIEEAIDSCPVGAIKIE